MINIQSTPRAEMKLYPLDTFAYEFPGREIEIDFEIQEEERKYLINNLVNDSIAPVFLHSFYDCHCKNIKCSHDVNETKAHICLLIHVSLSYD